MNIIDDYLIQAEISQSEFSRLIGVSIAMLYQYRKGIRPVSEKVAVRIEKATKGKISRKSFFPDDWHEIWPELINAQ